VASRSSRGLVPPSPAHAADLLASLPGVMAPQALAFCSPAESWPLSCATVVCLAGSTARWLRRCRLEGGSDYIGPFEGKRAVVGVSLHFGPVATLPYWLRAHGIVLTSVRTPAIDSLQGLTNYQFSLSPPADVPMFLSTSEIGLSPRLSSIRKILGPTGRLGMLVDVDRGKQFYVPFENRLFRMATGPIRLAQKLDAELVPVLIVETSTWKYTIHFGSPGTATLPW
jgi:lauroyl/myristoyl acyltransferase